VINGQVVSDTIPVNVATAPAPTIRDLTDINFDHSVPSPGKIMILGGSFGCQTAATQTVNYPNAMGNCTVNFDNGSAAPLLYTSDTQINILLPSNLPVGSRTVRVTRSDPLGSFNSNPFPFNVSLDVPIAIKTGASVIVTEVRNDQLVVIGPNDSIHPGEYFTIYLTGGSFATLPSTANVGGTDVPIAAAVVSWAQGVTQVNIQAPPTPTGVSNVRLGLLPIFTVRIN